MPDGTFVLLKDVCGTLKSGIIESIFILTSPSWQGEANHDTCIIYKSNCHDLQDLKKACNLESILFCFKSSAKKMTHYVFCLMQAWKTVARHSVFAHSQARMPLLFTNGRNANGAKIKQNCFNTPAPCIPKWIGPSGKISVLPAGYFINVVKVIFCFIAVRSLHSLNYVSNECLAHQFWRFSTNCNVSVLARSLEHPLKQKPLPVAANQSKNQIHLAGLCICKTDRFSVLENRKLRCVTFRLIMVLLRGSSPNGSSSAWSQPY